jgi:hypothetical protein
MESKQRPSAGIVVRRRRPWIKNLAAKFTEARSGELLGPDFPKPDELVFDPDDDRFQEIGENTL